MGPSPPPSNASGAVISGRFAISAGPAFPERASASGVAHLGGQLVPERTRPREDHGDVELRQLLSDASKTLMNERTLGWSEASNSAAYPSRFWKSGRWTQTRSKADQALFTLHPNHPPNDPTP
jgi:hypothetical protein